MDPHKKNLVRNYKRRSEWRFTENFHIILLYLALFTVKSNCQSVVTDESSHIESSTKIDFNLDSNVDSNHCHSCQFSSSKNIKNEDFKKSDDNNIEESNEGGFLVDFVDSISVFTEKYVLTNETEQKLERILESAVDKAMSKDKFEIIEGIEIKPIDKVNVEDRGVKEDKKGRALFSSYTYEYRLLQKIKNFIDTHIISINLPKAVGIRSFGLKKFFLPLLIGAQVFKSILLAMFLPSILGSFGKILGKGISQLSASSSQASYPPANPDDQTGYSNDNKDFMGYETNQEGSYMYPQDGMSGTMDDPNDLSSIDMSRFCDDAEEASTDILQLPSNNSLPSLTQPNQGFGASGQKVSYLPSKNSYYKNQMTSNSYKIFQKIPASSMILSNYDPFYSPLLSRLDGIFARLGLAPAESSEDNNDMRIGGQSLSEVKLEACREQLICLMYASPAKYAPYSNLVSAQLSRELNELRRPVSDNPEILRFFRYMRAARRGQEGTDCMRAHPACAANTAPQHTMIAAYHDINKLVTARKLKT